MSRIQTILDKAEREGTARRFRADVVPPAAPEPAARAAVATPFGAGQEPRPTSPGSWTDAEAAVPPTSEWQVRAHQGPTDAVRPTFAPRTSAPGVPGAEPVTVDALRPLDGLRPNGGADDDVAWRDAAAPLAPEAAVGVEAPATDEGGPGAAPPLIAARRPLSPSLVAALHPNALAAEQFRTLRTRIANSANGRGARTLLLTSPGHGEGKSVMAANLALTMGQEIQQRVCLVDASLRDATIHSLFGLADGPGLVDVLVGDAVLDDVLVYLEDHAITVLPAGRLPRHPAELLAGREMRKTLDTLRSRFDRVVIDAPPAMPMADVSILTPLVDGVLVICRAGVTETPALQQAVSGLDASRVLGVVLNDSQP